MSFIGSPIERISVLKNTVSRKDLEENVKAHASLGDFFTHSCVESDCILFPDLHGRPLYPIFLAESAAALKPYGFDALVIEMLPYRIQSYTMVEVKTILGSSWTAHHPENYISAIERCISQGFEVFGADSKSAYDMEDGRNNNKLRHGINELVAERVKLLCSKVCIS